MNLLIIPFHDWRKVQREGERTRDAHLIREMADSDQVDKILIVNRPISLPEMVYRRTWWKCEGDLLHSDSRGHLVQVAPKTYVLDTLDKSIVGPLIRGKRHFFDAYGSQALKASVDWHLIMLGMHDFSTISFNVYAAELFAQLDSDLRHFDAWDNFLRFPSNQKIRPELESAYATYARTATSWSTNSEENSAFYNVMHQIPDCSVIRNGVRPELFQIDYPIPDDLQNVARPIVGMGLKVTHLLDVDLLNQVIWNNPGISFVLIGQILDRAVYDRIRKVANFHYLGDKHYRDYPAYVRHFDVCLIPYCVGDKQHGGDAIKFYEYLAADKPVVSTPGNGVTDSFEGVWLETSHSRFSDAVQSAVNCGPIRRDLPVELTWAHKSEQMLTALSHSTDRKELYVV
ncbi:MAG: glycosyltransferase [bacterium]|nr:glycosyltransferase [bacterium]